MDCEIPLPHIKPFAYQVAGHMPHEAERKLGFLECNDSTVLKPSQKPDSGFRESEFYRSVFDNSREEHAIIQLRQHLPKYYGVHKIHGSASYLKLENVVSKFRKPCIMDIKIGRKTYDPSASSAKIARSVYKYPHNVRLGFQISGMQVYDPETASFKSYDKLYCRNWGEENIINGLDVFFGKTRRRKEIIKSVLQKLRSLEEWFQNQRMFAFYSSSILIVFEGDTETSPLEQKKLRRHLSRPPLTSKGNNALPNAKSCMDMSSTNIDNLSSGLHRSLSENPSSDTGSRDENNSINDENTKTNDVDIKMIDFTHVWNVDHQDQNYLFGLQNVMHYLTLLLETK